mmetsp:Transcript_23873/g.35649  ORF Transcript_23873/g.35649 Transcript_23873/m.35649 type:complete len:94 (+) Transcript_23873:492-773(+)
MARDVVSNEEGVIIASLWTRSRRGRFTSARSHEPVRQGSLMLHTMLRATLNSHYHNGHKAHATTLPLEADRRWFHTWHEYMAWVKFCLQRKLL